MKAKRRTYLLTILAVPAILLSAACSPEAVRSRGAGPGGDVGNRILGPSVEIHGQQNQMYKTPELGKAIQEVK